VTQAREVKRQERKKKGGFSSARALAVFSSLETFRALEHSSHPVQGKISILCFFSPFSRPFTGREE
jgi:hypothetical protein